MSAKERWAKSAFSQENLPLLAAFRILSEELGKKRAADWLLRSMRVRV